MHGFDNNRRRWMRQAGALAVGAGAATACSSGSSTRRLAPWPPMHPRRARG